MAGPQQATLAEVRAWLAERREAGCECPACGQRVQLYRRHISGAMARNLILAHRRHGTGWFEVGAVIDGHPGDFAKLRYWRLIEPRPGVRDDGSHRTGWWRLTPLGTGFVADTARVPRSALIYNGVCEALADEPVGIRDVLGSRFRYDDLMAGI